MRTNKRVKWNIVFPQKVEQLHLLWVFPPLFPIATFKIVSVGVVFGNA